MTAQELKNSVLRRAFRGELVERRDEEGTGAELLKQIEAEKTALTKAGKLKKEKPLPPITDEEKPFEIPEHWTWTRLGKIVNLLSGQDMPPSQYNANGVGIPYITGASNIEDSQVIINRWTESPKAIAANGCLLLTCKGTVGKTAILKEPQVHIARQLMAITPFLIGVPYIRFFIETQIDSLKSQAKSMIPGIERKNVLNLPIPLPPLAEQARIVAKLEEIWPEIERYAAARDELEALNRRFPNDLRKAVLQSAIRGELVERRDEEGTGAELLKQIEAEKAALTKTGKLKKEKPLPPITEEEKPFEIPEHWTWTRLGEIGRLLSGQDMPPSLYNANRLGIPYITGASNIEDSQVIINRWTESPKAVATCGCLLLTCKGTVGKTAILKEQQVHIARQLMAITPILVGVRYIRFFIETQIDFLKSQAKSMIPGIERKNVLNLPIPLPPLAEQARIVAKLEEILPLCDRLR